MELQNAILQVFSQLADSMNRLSGDQYIFPCKNLSGNTIGQHVRHIIEMFQCLENGYQNGVVDYEKRKRDRQIETDKPFAAGLLQETGQQLGRENKPLFLRTFYGELQDKPEMILSNYYRELAYNLEHTIHHMALIRIGLRELGDIPVADTYGVASSTIKYRKQCAQ